MSNKVNISTTTNKVTITPQNVTNITARDTNTSVTVNQESTQQIKVQTLGARGPQGPKGDPSDQADSIYVDIDNGGSTFYIPMMGVPTSDTYYDLKLPTNYLVYQPSTDLAYGNPLQDIFGNDNIDQLTVGRGANTAGAIFLNSTVDKPSIIYSDEPLWIQSYDALYLTASSIHLSSSVHIHSSYIVDSIVDVSVSDGDTHQIGSGEHIIFVSYTGDNGTATINLPLVADNENRQIRIMTDESLSNSKDINIAPHSSDTSATIDGSATFNMDRAYDGVMVMCHNSNWWIIQRKSK